MSEPGNTASENESGAEVQEAPAEAKRRHADLSLRPVGCAVEIDGKFAGDPQIRHPVATRRALLGSDIAVKNRHGLALRVVTDDHASHGFQLQLFLL